MQNIMSFCQQYNLTPQQYISIAQMIIGTPMPAARPIAQQVRPTAPALVLTPQAPSLAVRQGDGKKGGLNLEAGTGAEKEKDGNLGGLNPFDLFKD